MICRSCGSHDVLRINQGLIFDACQSCGRVWILSSEYDLNPVLAQWFWWENTEFGGQLTEPYS